MANFPIATRSSQAANISALIEADAGPASFRIHTAGFAALLCSVPLNEPAFTESGGVLTLSETPSAPSALCTAAGVAAVWEIIDGDGTRVVDDVIGNGLTIDDPNVIVGTPINLSGITLEVPAAAV